MAVVGSHRQPFPSLLHYQYQFPHDRKHVDVAIQVIRLEEISLLIAPRTPEMDEVNAVAEFLHHRRKIVVGPHSEGAGTEAGSIIFRRHCLEELAQMLRRANNAG